MADQRWPDSKTASGHLFSLILNAYSHLVTGWPAKIQKNYIYYAWWLINSILFLFSYSYISFFNFFIKLSGHPVNKTIEALKNKVFMWPDSKILSGHYPVIRSHMLWTPLSIAIIRSITICQRIQGRSMAFSAATSCLVCVLRRKAAVTKILPG